MHRFFTTASKRSVVVFFLVLFVLAAVGGSQSGNPVIEKEHTPNAIVCDIHTPVTDAACSAGGILLLLLSLLAAAWAGVNVFFYTHSFGQPLWRLYRSSYPCGEQRTLSPLQEAFRKGIIHPKIYHRAA